MLEICTRLRRGRLTGPWLISLIVFLLAFAGVALAQGEPVEEKSELRIDPLGRTDALTLLFFPDTPRPEPETPEGVDPAGAQGLAGEQPLPEAAYPWQAPLWENAGAVLEEHFEGPTEKWNPRWYFFPAEAGATLTWIVIPLDQPIPEGSRLVAMLRAEDDSGAKVLGDDKFPFVVRETSGGLIASAARSVMPGRYAMVTGVADDAGNFTPHAGQMQVVARVGEDRLRLSPPILAETLKKLDEGAQPGAFRVSGFEVVPRSGKVVKTGEDVSLFYEVLGAQKGADGQHNLNVSYQLSYKHPARGWVKQRPQVSEGQTGVVRAWSFPVAPQYPETDYKILITVKDNVGGGSVSKTVEFAVEKQ